MKTDREISEQCLQVNAIYHRDWQAAAVKVDITLKYKKMVMRIIHKSATIL